MKRSMTTSALVLLCQGSIALAADIPFPAGKVAFNQLAGVEYDSGGPVGPIDPVSPRTTVYDPPEKMTLSFIFHIDDGMAEQDVFYEKVPGSGEVFRPTAATREMDAPLYAPAVKVPHNFLDTSDTGPYPKGRPLGLTLAEWFAAKGNGTYACTDGKGTLDLEFSNLIPNGIYTIWHDFMVWPPTDPFIGTYDLPLGARDGSENQFVAGADGSASFKRTFSPCLQLSGEHLLADLGLAWHSDGKTYGPLTGEFSTQTHVQLFVMLPTRTGL